MAGLDKKEWRRLARELAPPLLKRSLVSIHGSLYNSRYQETLAKNQVLKNKHQGDRCFILGNAPSILDHDLNLLGGEKMFTISNGYLNPVYKKIRPQYHCLPQLTFSDVEGGMTENKAVEWFSEMDDALGEAEIFLHINEHILIKKNNLFNKRKVWFIGSHRSISEKFSCDLTRAIAPIASAPQMVLAIAMFMGFKEIYLLGVDHDFVRTRKYHYFFERSKLKAADPSVKDDGSLNTSVTDDLRNAANLFSGYETIASIARGLSVKIFNCSASSMLDMFPRINLEEVMSTDA